MEAGGTLKWALFSLSTEAQTSNFHKGKKSFYNVNFSTFFFSFLASAGTTEKTHEKQKKREKKEKQKKRKMKHNRKKGHKKLKKKETNKNKVHEIMKNVKSLNMSIVFGFRRKIRDDFHCLSLLLYFFFDENTNEFHFFVSFFFWTYQKIHF